MTPETGTMTWGRILWPAWIILTALSFFAPEIYALTTNNKNDLSQWAWAELHVTPMHIPIHTIAWWISLLAFTFAIGILVAHIWFHVGG